MTRMTDAIDWQEFQRLAREHEQLQYAFRELGTFLGAALTGRAMLDPEYVAASLDQLAVDAGDKLAERTVDGAVPNPHLLFIAEEVRKLCGQSSPGVKRGKEGRRQTSDRA